jgi:hypothetical protein
MNFFFGLKSKSFQSEIQIPLFRNKDLKSFKINLFRARPINNKWEFTKLNIKPTNKDFYIIKNKNIFNNVIFFLAYEKNASYFDKNFLCNYNKFTNTVPAFRSNLNFFLKKGGFSSYQSEYPFEMVNKQGTILSSISSLANCEADKNFIIIKNIFQSPVHDEFNAYLFNIKKEKIEKKFLIKTNYTNIIEIEKKFIKPEMFLVTSKYLCIPIYISQKGKHLSVEHTHPPHEYILSQNKFKKISDIKKKINEIIYKKSN